MRDRVWPEPGGTWIRPLAPRRWAGQLRRGNGSGRQPCRANQASIGARRFMGQLALAVA